MTSFEQEYFQKFKFNQSQINRYVESARRDFNIAQKDPFLEVRFTYCYQALIKIGIAVLAKKGSEKVRSVSGHHVKILNKMSEILNDPDIFTIDNAIRMKRNKDVYDGQGIFAKKEVDDYVTFVGQVIDKAKQTVA